MASLTTAPGPSSSVSVPRASRPLSSAPRRVQTVNVKIVKAVMKPGVNGRPEFTPLTQTFVDVTESTANTTYILNAVQRKWGAQYVIVTSDGLPIDDGSGTQGRLFILSRGTPDSLEVLMFAQLKYLFCLGYIPCLYSPRCLPLCCCKPLEW